MSAHNVESSSQSALSAANRVVIVSAFHDYRSLKKASLQPTAKGLVRSGYDVSFISMRFSLLSSLTGDSRNSLFRRSNKTETVDGVRCLLWRTMLHPFAHKWAWLSFIMNPMFVLYSHANNRTLDRIVACADFIIVESGVAAIFLRRFRRSNQTAKIIYYAADRLNTVGTHPYVARSIKKNLSLIDHVILRSKKMSLPKGVPPEKTFYVGFGVDPDDYADIPESPYQAGLNAVSVGAMLFDIDFFLMVAPRFPLVTFHVIGAGQTFAAPSNVCQYNEMAFRDTLKFVKYASVGLAPYRPAPDAEYLADSSLKMSQYDYFGIPTVCPGFATGTSANRFGYVPGNADSMADALHRAIEHIGKTERKAFPSWKDIGERVLRPTDYPDTK